MQWSFQDFARNPHLHDSFGCNVETFSKKILACLWYLLENTAGANILLQGLADRLAFVSIDLHWLTPLRHVKLGALSQTTGHARHQPRAAVMSGVVALKLVLVVRIGKLIIARIVGKRVASDGSFGPA